MWYCEKKSQEAKKYVKDISGQQCSGEVCGRGERWVQGGGGIASVICSEPFPVLTC